MFNKEIASKVLNECLSTGADYAEIFFEKTTTNNLQMMSSKLDDVKTSFELGAGIRIIKGVNYVYGYTNDCSFEGLFKLASNLKTNYNETQKVFVDDFEEYHCNLHPISRLSKDIPNNEKVALLEAGSKKMYEYDPRIVQGVVRFFDETQEVTIATSLKKYSTETRNHQRIFCIAVAKENELTQQGSESLGGNKGIELFSKEKIEELGVEAARQAITMLHADSMVGGVYDVVIHNAFGGVVFHEACGHSLEATSVSKGLSVFCNKLGTKIANDLVTAIDDGTITNEWGSTGIDDEGNKTQKRVLIENGILKSYLVDMRNGIRMNQENNGCSRRQNYKYAPTSRMSNTYIANGKSTFEEIIENTKFGLFAKKMGGGSVNPATGEYNFSVSEGYMIRDGKICEPVKGATLIGSGAQTLMNIDMVGNNLSLSYGVCGSESGSVFTTVGQPTIRVKNLTVGGTGGKK